MPRALWAIGILLFGCGTTAPNIQVVGQIPAEVPPIYLTAARQKEQIAAALRQVGFQLVPGVADSPYLMRVSLGIDQQTRACGTLNNVRYELRTSNESIIVAEAKGWTGSCEPNVLVAVSKELRARILDTPNRRSPQ